MSENLTVTQVINEIANEITKDDKLTEDDENELLGPRENLKPSILRTFPLIQGPSRFYTLHERQILDKKLNLLNLDLPLPNFAKTLKIENFIKTLTQNKGIKKMDCQPPIETISNSSITEKQIEGKFYHFWTKPDRVE